MVFKPLNKEVHNEFILHSLRNLGLKNSITGSVQGQLTRKNVENLGVVLPDSQVLKTYCDIVAASVEEDLVLDMEIEKATSMRDFLLPQLINGHLKISATA
jgi:restriction endonuclease S subunit